MTLLLAPVGISFSIHANFCGMFVSLKFFLYFSVSLLCFFCICVAFVTSAFTSHCCTQTSRQQLSKSFRLELTELLLFRVSLSVLPDQGWNKPIAQDYASNSGSARPSPPQKLVVGPSNLFSIPGDSNPIEYKYLHDTKERGLQMGVKTVQKCLSPHCFCGKTSWLSGEIAHTHGDS